MKTALIPQVRVEPEFREELEAALQRGETLSQFIEAAVRNALKSRLMQNVDETLHLRNRIALSRRTPLDAWLSAVK